MPDENHEWLRSYFGMDKEAAAQQEADNVQYREKLAADMLVTRAAVEQLEKKAAARGVDLSRYTDSEILEAAIESYNPEQVKTASAGVQTAEEEFVELHKFAGQIQGFAAFKTFQDLQKEAGRVGDAASKLKNFGNRMAGEIGQAERKVSGGIGEKLTSKATADTIQESALGKALGPDMGDGLSLRQLRNKAKEIGDLDLSNAQVSRGRKALGGAAALTAAGGTAGAVALGKRDGDKDGKVSESSSVENLVQLRMYDMLKEAGYVDQSGNILQPGQTKTAQEELLDAVDVEALQRLRAAGYQ